MKTAIQEAIEKTESSIAKLKTRQNAISHQNRIQVEFIEFKVQALSDNLVMLKSLLPKEREQIEQAYYDGGDNMCSNGELGQKQAQEYYNETFKL